MKKSQQGFTLVEAMMVVAIIGLLAAFAIPAYQGYVIRSQVSEGYSLTSGAQAAVTEYYMESGGWPNLEALAGLYEVPNISGTYTKHLTIEDNVIRITYAAHAHPAIANAEVNLVATDHDGSVTWRCAGSKSIVAKHLPQVCR